MKVKLLKSGTLRQLGFHLAGIKPKEADWIDMGLLDFFVMQEHRDRRRSAIQLDGWHCTRMSFVLSGLCYSGIYTARGLRERIKKLSSLGLLETNPSKSKESGEGMYWKLTQKARIVISDAEDFDVEFIPSELPVYDTETRRLISRESGGGGNPGSQGGWEPQFPPPGNPSSHPLGTPVPTPLRYSIQEPLQEVSHDDKNEKEDFSPSVLTRAPGYANGSPLAHLKDEKKSPITPPVALAPPLPPESRPDVLQRFIAETITARDYRRRILSFLHKTYGSAGKRIQAKLEGFPEQGVFAFYESIVDACEEQGIAFDETRSARLIEKMARERLSGTPEKARSSFVRPPARERNAANGHSPAPQEKLPEMTPDEVKKRKEKLFALTAPFQTTEKARVALLTLWGQWLDTQRDVHHIDLRRIPASEVAAFDDVCNRSGWDIGIASKMIQKAIGHPTWKSIPELNEKDLEEPILPPGVDWAKHNRIKNS